MIMAPGHSQNHFATLKAGERESSALIVRMIRVPDG